MRLRPLTDDTLKEMVDVAGEPLLAYVFETLIESGVDELVVIVGYHDDAIRSFFGDAAEDVPITYIEQREQLGLDHGILQARSHVDGPFVVLNGDNVVAGDLHAQVARQQCDSVDAVVCVESVGRATAQETCVVSVDGGRVASIVEKPQDPPSTLITTGCYVLSEEIFDALALLRPSDQDEYELTDAIGVFLRAGAHVEAVPLKSERVNVNTLADISTAETLIADTD